MDRNSIRATSVTVSICRSVSAAPMLCLTSIRIALGIVVDILTLLFSIFSCCSSSVSCSLDSTLCSCYACFEGWIADMLIFLKG